MRPYKFPFEPWKVVDNGHGIWISGADYTDICWIDTTGISKEQQRAIGNLLKKAPELYRMLAKLKDGAKEKLTPETYEEIAKLLREARGEE